MSHFDLKKVNDTYKGIKSTINTILLIKMSKNSVNSGFNAFCRSTIDKIVIFGPKGPKNDNFN